jgi:PAS domain S-box-containing protein
MNTKFGKPSQVKLTKATFRIAGHTRWLSDHKTIILGDEESVVSVDGVVFDITERKQILGRTELLNSLNERLLVTGGLNYKVKLITEEIIKIFKADFARIWIIKSGDLCDSECQHAKITEGPDACHYRERCLHLLASSGRYTHIDGGHRRVPFGSFKIGKVASGDESKFLTNDVANDPLVSDHEWAIKLGLVSFAGYRLSSEDGGVIGVMALFRKQVISREEDALLENLAARITQIIQKTKIKEALLESEKKYRIIYENAVEGFFQSTPEGRFVSVNSAFSNMLGYDSPEDLVSSISDIATQYYVNLDDRKRYKKILKDNGIVENFEFKAKRKDGSAIWVSNSTRAYFDSDGRVIRYEGIVLDITERKQAEKKLQKSEILHNEAQSVAQIGHWELDSPSGKPLWSEEVFHIFGLDPKKSEPSFSAHVNIIHDEDWDLLDLSIQELSTNGKPFDIEFRILRPGGGIRWMHARGSAYKGEDGSIARMFGTAQDITDRKQAEEEVIRSDVRHKKMIANISDVIAIMDSKGTIKYKSPNIKKWFGWNPEDLIATDYWATVHLDDLERIQKEFFSLLGKDNSSKKMEYRYKCKNGSYKWIELTAVNLTNDSIVSGVLMNYQDISERKQSEEAKYKLEAQLRQANKMESIGTLTGGIAHDFNNIMGIILGNTELALEDVPESNRAYPNLEAIKTASRKGANIVKQLRNFSRITDQKLQPIEIAPVIKDTLKFLRSTIPKTIDIQQDIQITNETILADPIQMKQIIMNLCINASQAMEQTSGNLNITVEKVILDDVSAPKYPDLRIGKYIKVMVGDAGPGIDPEIIDRIFDPYFTTKGVGKGSGMGLAVVHSIVKIHSGAITVDSTLGKGTKFIMFFPLVTEKPMVEVQTT